MANTFVAFKKSALRVPESSIRIKSAAVMPWRWAISNTSAMAHSTRFRSGSAGGLCCPVIHCPPSQRFAFSQNKRRMGLKCLLRAFFEVSQLHLRIAANPALRIACAQDRQTPMIVKQKIANLEGPHCAGTSRPCLFKSAHFFGRRTLSKFIVGKAGG